MLAIAPHRYREIEETIVEFLSDFGKVSYPFDIFGFLLGLGIRLVPYSSLPLKNLRALMLAYPDAVTRRPQNFDVRKMTIFYNDIGRDAERVRFTLAHELAHLVLEHPSDDEPFESEANYGAGYILAPDPIVAKFSKRDAAVIKHDFSLSDTCAHVVLRHTCNRLRCGKPAMPYEKKIIGLCDWKKGGVAYESA